MFLISMLPCQVSERFQFGCLRAANLNYERGEGEGKKYRKRGGREGERGRKEWEWERERGRKKGSVRYLLDSCSSSAMVSVFAPTAAAEGSVVETGLADSWSITSRPFSSAT